MAVKTYDLYKGHQIWSVKDEPNVRFSYDEHPSNIYKDVFSITKGDRVLVEITGKNVVAAVKSIIDGADKFHRQKIREYLDYIDEEEIHDKR